jgi:hypothetical protein
MKMGIVKIKEQMGKITDHRRQWGYLRRKFTVILFISLCAIICGADEFEEIEIWAKAHEKWLKKFIEMPNGIPSEDTFRRVFERLNPEEVGKCLYSLFSEKQQASGKTVAIDGKTICGSKNAEHSAYHVLSACVAENQRTLGEIYHVNNTFGI